MVPITKNKLIFTNEVINKKKLQQLMYFAFQNYGIIKSSIIADRVKNLTFHYATTSGISLNVEDLRVPSSKRGLIGLTNSEVNLTEQNYTTGNINTVERFQKIIDIWNNANNVLKDDVLTYFRESDPLNPLYIMAFSGARGNISQVRQLVGMRGLMADPQGQIIDLPIQSNFREGLKVTEYIISSYGARKGLVDTALRTADSGYLTRRLVDVAQDIIVREEDCLTKEGLSLDELFKIYKTDASYDDRLIGRLLLKDITIDKEGIYWPENMEIDGNIVEKILKFKVNSVEVRSPLTCNSLRSICRKCYGWHLSYSKLIDLGEAVGILAAQSIGEPGTQLTMRTFHTGGVFSGDSTKQIRVPYTGTVNYKVQNLVKYIRTIHGERGFQLLEELTVQVEATDKSLCSLKIPKNALVLVNPGQKVYRNQIIAEVQKTSNLILEADKKDIFTSVSGETFLQSIKIQESVDSEGAITKTSRSNGFLWILYGKPLLLPANANLLVKTGQTFNSQQKIGSQNLINNFPGIIKIEDSAQGKEIKVLVNSMSLENAFFIDFPDKIKLLKLQTSEGSKLFQLCIKEGASLKQGQKLAYLIDDTYKTETGGILYYSTDNFTAKKRKKQKTIFNGFLYWIPEETHSLTTTNKKVVQVKNGEFVEKNTCLFPNIYSQTEGIAHINNEDSELIIKPGEFYRFEKNQLRSGDITSRFVQPGELIFKNQHFVIQKLSFLEFFNFNGLDYILLRPVIRYHVPQDKGFFMEHKFFPENMTRGLALQTLKRIFYKDGERVKTNKGGVLLLQTFLVLEIKPKYASLHAQLNYAGKTKQKLKISLFEIIKSKNNNSNNIDAEEKSTFKTLVQDNQYIPKNTIVGNLELFLTGEGKILRIQKTKTNLELLLLRTTDTKTFYYDNSTDKLLIKQGDLIRVGSFLTKKIRSKYAGQIYHIGKDTIILRHGRPSLISEGAVLRVDNQTLVEKSDILATLVYNKLKTVDIVQGLPKVEEILEARKIKNGCILAPTEGKIFRKDLKIEITKPSGERFNFVVEPNIKTNFRNGTFVKFLEPLNDGPINPHDKLETLFNYYSLTTTIHLACKKAFKHLQLFLVNEVQKTYFSQGVQIADKHIEIIVKQMTSKVRVFSSGATTLLPGEILDIYQAEMITNAAVNIGEEPPLYKPILLGLTKASLNSDSFISAASFQETTRVLTEAAIEGKRDWLYGLKENVIIGRLIPAGTGFNCFENLKKVGREPSSSIFLRPKKEKNLKSSLLNLRITQKKP